MTRGPLVRVLNLLANSFLLDKTGEAARALTLGTAVKAQIGDVPLRAALINKDVIYTQLRINWKNPCAVLFKQC